MTEKTGRRCSAVNKHILVTEDDKNVADGLREILESDGYTVSCADRASAAMQTMR